MSELKSLIKELREFEGVKRKQPIEDVVKLFESVKDDYNGTTLIDFGDDAAVIDIGGNDVILFSADGIWGKITDASPWWAGYTSVLVNVNDISAMGGKPIAMVNVLASNNLEICNELIQGINEGIKKFGVPMVGGHMHPDTPYTSISVAIIGIAKKDSIIRSDTAKDGNIIIVAYDMDGKIGRNSPYSWDSTSFKDSKKVRDMYMVMQKLGEAGLVTSGKDISNPGTIGTLGMLCESSHVGASVDITKIPLPNSVPLAQWLKVYPATGYIVTATEDNVEPCITTFEETGLTAAAIGTIDNTGKIELLFEDESDTAFDFRYDSITGINMKS